MSNLIQELEEKLMRVASVMEDLDTVLLLADEDLSDVQNVDVLQNALIGARTMVDARYTDMFNTFEEVVTTWYAFNEARQQELDDYDEQRMRDRLDILTKDQTEFEAERRNARTTRDNINKETFGSADDESYGLGS